MRSLALQRINLRPGKFLRLAAALFLSWTLSVPAAAPTDYQVKAVFLFNFAQFVEWPSTAFANDTSPVVIGILGDDPFGVVLEATLKGEVARGRKIVVKHFTTEDDPRDCQILFISRSEAERVGALLESLKGTHVLTVSETEKFCERGGMINFIRQDQNVRLEINRRVTESAGLKINARLLSLARLVKTET